MLCPGCGVEVGSQMRYCPQCARQRGQPEHAPLRRTARPQEGSTRHELLPVGSTHAFAGFFLRTGALLLDIAIFILLFRIAQLTLAGFFPEQIPRPRERIWAFFSGGPRGALRIFAPRPVTLLSAVVYSSLCEYSRFQATPGKFYMGLAVTTTDGERMTLIRSVIRSTGKILSYWSFGLGYLLMLGTWKRQALHDKIAQTIVVDSVRGSYMKFFEALVVSVVILLFSELFLMGKQ